MKAFLFLAEGFEEIEAIVPVDVLRRADIEVTTISINNERQVKGARGVSVYTDKLFSQADFTENDVLILPGGMPGTKNLGAYSKLVNLLYEQNQNNKLIAAICAAPSILGKMGILTDKEATCFPGFEDQMVGAKLSEKMVVQAGNILTAKGAGVAIPFALKIVEILKGKIVADKVAKTICAD